MIDNFIRGIVKNHPEIKLKLKKAASKQTPFQYIYQTLMMSFMSLLFFFIILFLTTRNNLLIFGIGAVIIILLSPLIYGFWFGFVDVQISKIGRELDSDLLFVSEYLLVSLESGLPLGNAIQRISRLNRPGGKFFNRVFTEFKTGKDLETALDEASTYSASENLRVLLKRLKDSLTIGVDLKTVLENYIEESSEKKIIEIKGYSKKLNPIIMMYLLLGIVVPSLGITFFILAATLLEMTPQLLKLILICIFLVMFAFQYITYTLFKFSKSTL